MQRSRFWRQLKKVRLRFLSDRLDYHWRVFLKESDIRWWQRQAPRHASAGGYCVEEIITGLPMRLYFDSELCWLIYSNSFELAERHIIEALLKPGETFVDVGANIGLFTLLAAKQVGPTGKVISFEPCGQTFERLTENVRMNGLTQVSCHQAALSRQTEELCMATSTAGRDAWNSLVGSSSTATLDAQATETVKCLPWDDFAQEHDLVGRVQVMKIDVEGWEMNVLQGARETLSRDDAPVLQVEFTDEAALAAGSSCQELYRELESLGYTLYRIDAARQCLVHQPLQDDFPYINLYAVKNLEPVQQRIEEFRIRTAGAR